MRKTWGGKAESVEALAAALAESRRAAEVRRADALERERADAAYARRRADMATQVRLAELDRAEREAAAEASARLGRLYREATEAGERTRIAAGLARSGEARALRLEKLRTLNLRVLVPVLLGFAAWSTTGVQHGAARLMGVQASTPMWWVLWLLEPVLIGAVVWVIVARAQLESAGGRMDRGAERIAWGCLATSIVLNLVSAVPTNTAQLDWFLAGAMLAHAIGPVGAAATAHLIGLVDKATVAADPWDGAVPLAAMDLRPPASVLDRIETTNTDTTADTTTATEVAAAAATEAPVETATSQGATATDGATDTATGSATTTATGGATTTATGGATEGADGAAPDTATRSAAAAADAGVVRIARRPVTAATSRRRRIHRRRSAADSQAEKRPAMAAAWFEAHSAGEPLSGAELARRFEVSESYGRAVAKDCRDSLEKRSATAATDGASNAATEPATGATQELEEVSA